MKVALPLNCKLIKDAGFYFDFAAYVHVIYDCSLFSKYSEVQLFLIRIADNSIVRVLFKATFSLKVMIDSEALKFNFLKCLSFPRLRM